MMLSCKVASQLVSKSLDKPLNWQDRLALRFHLAICKRCKRFSQQLSKLRNMLKSMVAQTESDAAIQLSVEAKQRITKILQQGNQNLM